MPHFHKIFTPFIFLFIITNFYAQQQSIINVILDNKANVLKVKQTIIYTNTSNKSLSKIVINDWNHAYSDKNSALGIRFSDEFVRNFHLSTNKERGFTTIHNILLDNKAVHWHRVENHIDLIEIQLNTNLKTNESITLELEYSLKIPNSKFTKLGFDTNKYYLKNCFLTISRLDNNGDFLYYSNENIEDITNALYTDIALNIEVPLNFEVTTDLFLNKEEVEKDIKRLHFKANNRTEIPLSIEEFNTYENFSNETVDLVTNLKQNKLNTVQRALIIDKITKYVSDNLGELTDKKIMVSQVDYDRNPFYGINQLPSFLNPYSNELLYELKFLKVYLNSYLKRNLKLDLRKYSYIYNAIEVFYLIDYIEKYYPDLKIVGNISKFKILKGYNMFQARFNEQYLMLYLLMARKNLDQSIGDSKESFIKFNEQIAGKYKAGLCFKYLKNYLKDTTVETSFKEFIMLNKLKQTTSEDFEKIIRKNSLVNLDFFFQDLINSRKTIDYTFGKIKKTKDSLTIKIKNRSDAVVPISYSLFKNKQLISSYWLSKIAKDTTFTIQREEANQLVLNYNNEIPEFNLRNNFASLKRFPSFNRPLKFTFLTDFEDPKYNQVFYVPELGYNLYDGLLFEISFKNNAFINKPFVYNISPSFSSKTRSITGNFSFNYSPLFREKKMYQATYFFGSSYFHYFQNASYLKINPMVQFKFRNFNLRDNKRQFITLRSVFLNKDPLPQNAKVSQEVLNAPLKYTVFNTSYSISDSETSKGIGFGTNLQLASNFGKITTEFSFRKLFVSNYEISMRLYAGTFIYNNTNSAFYNFGLDRPNDYLFDYNYYGRSESTGLFSQQIIIAEGGFKSKFKNPYANKWMTTLNVSSTIWRWISLYGDVGFYKNKGESARFVYGTGIHLDLVPDYFELFLPAYSSNGFEMGQKNYQEKIRFIVTLNPNILIGLFKRKWF